MEQQLTVIDYALVLGLFALGAWPIYKALAGAADKHLRTQRAYAIKFESSLKLRDLGLSRVQETQLAALALARNVQQRTMFKKALLALLDEERTTTRRKVKR